MPRPILFAIAMQSTSLQTHFSLDKAAPTPLADDAEALEIVEGVESLPSARGDLIGSLPAGVASDVRSSLAKLLR